MLSIGSTCSVLFIWKKARGGGGGGGGGGWRAPLLLPQKVNVFQFVCHCMFCSVPKCAQFSWWGPDSGKAIVYDE